jgi:hypothetical protein
MQARRQSWREQGGRLAVLVNFTQGPEGLARKGHVIANTEKVRHSKGCRDKSSNPASKPADLWHHRRGISAKFLGITGIVMTPPAVAQEKAKLCGQIKSIKAQEAFPQPIITTRGLAQSMDAAQAPASRVKRSRSIPCIDPLIE